MKLIRWVFVFFPILVLGQTAFEKGERYYRLEKFDQAKVQFELALKQDGNDLKTLEYLGDIQCQFKQWEKAVPYYLKLTKLKPRQADYFYKYGGALGMQAKESNKFKALSMIGDVRRAFEKAVLLNPKHVAAHWALIEIYIQLPAVVGGSEKKAIQYSDALMQISAVDGHLAKGHIEEYFERYPQAEKHYKKAIEVGNSPATYKKLADLYQNKMKQPEKARQLMAAYNEKIKS